MDKDKALGLFRNQARLIIKTLLEDYVPRGYLAVGNDERAARNIEAAALRLHKRLNGEGE